MVSDILLILLNTVWCIVKAFHIHDEAQSRYELLVGVVSYHFKKMTTVDDSRFPNIVWDGKGLPVCALTFAFPNIVYTSKLDINYQSNHSDESY